MPPLFSIITATFNAAKSFPVLLDSLAAQTCCDFELVVQDGGSSDDTLAVVESYAARLPAVAILSEPDSGIYDAWNRAVSRARGEWLIFLGADDYLMEPGTLTEAMDLLRSVPRESGLAAASLELRGAKSRRVLSPVMEGFGSIFSIAPAPFPSLFVRCSLALDYPFDTSFRLAGDYDFLCRVWFYAHPVELNLCAVGMALGGMTADPRNWLKSDYEMFIAARRNLPKKAPLPKGLWPAMKSCMAYTVFGVLGLRRGAALLDRIRTLRGLPPSWADYVQPLLDE
ncbi:glycosyltransferase [Desulfocurvibacter africanus]|uniref:glycosyltransferase n=1 Tax=Desulfocurvibacter africanus TaxID=873 RepID=UPI002FD8B790